MLFGSEGKSVVTASRDGTLRLWDLTAEDPVIPQFLLKQDDWIPIIEPTRANQHVVTGRYRKLGAHVWDLDISSAMVGSPRKLPTSQWGLYLPVAISFDSHWLGALNVRQDRSVADVWDLSARSSFSAPLLSHFHDGHISRIAFSPDGNWFASAGEDLTAQVSNLSAEDSSSSTMVLRGHESAVTSVAISPDSRWVVTGSQDRTSRLWDLRIETLMAQAQKLVGRELTETERERYDISKRD